MNDHDSVLPDRILKFVELQVLLTLTTCLENRPHCAILYYAYSSTLNMLIFKSKGDSRHVMEGKINNQIAASISFTGSDIMQIKGAQIEGKFIEDNEVLNEAKKSYYKKFPFALVIPGDIWLIELTKIKFTDNSLGFSKKINWEK